MKVYMEVIGRELFGSHCCEEFALSLWRAICKGMKLLRESFNVIERQEDADVILVVLLACPCEFEEGRKKVDSMRKTGKRVVVLAPLPGACGASFVDAYVNALPKRINRFPWITEEELLHYDEEEKEVTPYEFAELMLLKAKKIIFG